MEAAMPRDLPHATSKATRRPRGGRPPFPEGERRRLLFVEYFCAELGIQPSAARKRLARGDFGPPIWFGRRLAVRAAAFERHIEGMESRSPVPRVPTRHKGGAA